MALLAWLAAFLAVGTFGFWLLIAVELVCLMVCMAKETGKWATASLVVTAVALNWLSGLPIFHWVSQHWVASIIFLVSYVVIGVCWSMFKWKLHSRNDAEMQSSVLERFRKTHSIAEGEPIPANLKEDWGQKRDHGDEDIGGCSRSNYEDGCRCPEKASAAKHKGDILRWMSWWPFSALWFAVNDFVMKIFNYLFQSLRTTFQRISDSSYKELKVEFGPEEKDGQRD